MSGPTKGMVAGKPIKTGAQNDALDEGWGRTFQPAERRPGKWVYDEHGVAHEVGAEWTGEAPKAHWNTEGVVYSNLQATDGTPIDSRKKHREYMRANNLSMASDFTEHWKKAEKQREEIQSGRADSKERKEIIGRAFHEARNKPRGKR
jgi:hypothetical protein